MKRRLRYHSLAQRDFVGAAAWSQAQWGARMTRRYLDAIEAQIQRIVENPMLGSDAELPRPGLRKITAGRHMIFYMADEHDVQIVRIMGQQQDHWSALGLR
ncbi:MAG: type II toxin-antitoxin system RelE/ParE family toxin [Pseudomonadota bacterium]